MRRLSGRHVQHMNMLHLGANGDESPAVCSCREAQDRSLRKASRVHEGIGSFDYLDR